MSEDKVEERSTPVVGPLRVTPLYRSSADAPVWWDGAEWNQLAVGGGGGSGSGNVTTGTLTTNALTYGSGPQAINSLAVGSTNNVLHGGAGTTPPTWSGVSLTSDVGGTLPVVNGGTGVASFPAIPGTAGVGGAIIRAHAGGTLFADGYWGTWNDGSLVAYLAGRTPYFDIAVAGGTAASPLPTPANTLIGSINFSGYLPSGWSTSTGTQGSAVIGVLAVDTYSATAAGTAFTFSTTAHGTLTYAERVRIGAGVMVDTSAGALPTGGDLGPGTINVASGYYVNGAPLAGGGNVSTTALTTNALTVGTGATAIGSMASLGTTTTVLHGNAAGLPTWGAVNLASGGDTTGTLTVPNGGTGATTLPVSATGFGMTGTFLLGQGTSPIIPMSTNTTGTVGTYGDSSVVCLGAGASGYIQLARCNGTLTGPTTINVGQNIGAIFVNGHNGSAWTANRAAQTFVAAETWSGTAQGTYIAFQTTQPTTTTAAERVRIGMGLMVGTTTDPGLGGLSLGSPLTVPNGGTGAITLANPAGTAGVGGAIVRAHGTGALTADPYWGTWGDPSLVCYYANNTSGGVGPYLDIARSRGTAAVPTATQSGDMLGAIDFSGYGTAWGQGGASAIQAFAAENFTATAQGSYLVFGTSTPGQATFIPRVRIGLGLTVDTSAGALPTGGDMGAGTINVAGGYYVNGAAVTGGGAGADTVTGGITAAGTTQGTATALTSQFNVVTTTAPGTGVALPAGTVGGHCLVRNSGANPLAVYPASGAAINAQAVNTAINVVSNSTAYFECQSATQWFSVP